MYFDHTWNENYVNFWKAFVKIIFKNPGFENKIIILQILFNNLNNKLFLAFNLYEIHKYHAKYLQISLIFKIALPVANI